VKWFVYLLKSSQKVFSNLIGTSVDQVLPGVKFIFLDTSDTHDPPAAWSWDIFREILSIPPLAVISYTPARDHTRTRLLVELLVI